MKISDWLNSYYGRERRSLKSSFGVTYCADSEVIDDAASTSTTFRGEEMVDSNSDNIPTVNNTDGARPNMSTSEPLWIETTSDRCLSSAKRLPTRLSSEPTTSSHGTANSRWGGRYRHAQSRLYIIVDPIDSETLSSNETQACLATLAACDSVSVIAVSDGVNCPIIWTEEISEKFNWTYHHGRKPISYLYLPS
jgi:hypothetical protein